MKLKLPVPDPSFVWKDTAAGPLLQCVPLLAVAQHGFTTVQLRLQAGAAPDDPAWQTLAEALGAAPARVSRVRQVHGCAVHLVSPGIAAGTHHVRPAADALVSADPGAVVAVVTADCVPVLLTDPQVGAVAAVHAGWRGTCTSIVEKTVRTMTERFGTDPSRVVAAIGPSIGACCYTVGDEVRGAFAAAGHSMGRVDRWFSNTEGSLRLDLWQANREQLLDAGIREDAVFTCRLCTATERGTFPSYRVNGPAAGRMAAAIVTPGH